MSRKKLKIYIEGDARDAERAFDSISGKAGKLGNIMGGALKAGAVVGAAAVAGLGAAFVSAVNDLGELDKLTKQVEAGIASTGGSAGVTAEHIVALSDSLEGMSSISQESILQGQNLLLTFTNIQNKAGEGNDIFDQASLAMTNMAAKMGTDAPTAAMQLGKALNDPVQGIGALRKAGVQLSDEQEAQVKNFIALGDVMSAQKVILGELNTQFGGSAEALGNSIPGALALAKDAFGDFLRDGVAPIGGAIKDISTGFIDMLKGFDPGLLQSAFSSISGVIVSLVPVMGTIGTALMEVMATVGPIISGAMERLAPLFDRLLVAILPILDPLFKIGEIIINVILDAVEALMPIVEALAPILTTILAFVASALEKIGPVLGKIVQQLADLLARILEKMEPHIEKLLDLAMRMIDAILPVLPKILDALMPILEVLLKLVDPIMAIITKFGELYTVVIEKVGAIYTWVIDKLGGLFEWIIGAISGFAGIWSSVWETVKSIFAGVWDGIKAIYNATIAPVVDALKGVWSGLQSAWESAWSTLKGVVKGAVLGILNVLKPMAYALDALNIFSGEAVFEGPVIRAIEAVRAWHKGGWIPGTHEILLPLGLFEGGEFIIPRQAAAEIGPGNLEAIRRGQLPGGLTVNINFNGTVISDDRSWEEMARKLQLKYIPRVARAMAMGGTA